MKKRTRTKGKVGSSKRRVKKSDAASNKGVRSGAGRARDVHGTGKRACGKSNPRKPLNPRGFIQIEDALAAYCPAASVGVFVKNGDLRYTRVNPAMACLLNRSAESFLGLSDHEVFGPEMGKRIRRADRRVLGGRSIQEVYDFSINGAIRRLRMARTPLRNHENRVVGLFGTVYDVSSQDDADEESYRDEARYRALVERVPIGLFRATPEGRLLEANPALVKMLGFGAFEEIAGRSMTEQNFGPPYDQEKLRSLLGRGGEIVGLETPWTRSDGSTVWLRENIRAIRAADGRVMYYEGSVEDVTDRVLVEQELRKVLDRTELALWGADLTAWDWNVPTGTIAFSRRALEIFDCSASELPRHIDAFYDWIHPEDRASVERTVRGHLIGETPFYESEYRLRGNRNEWRWILARGKAVERGAQGTAERVVGTMLDVTARKQAEQALREQQDLLRAVIDGSDDAIFVKDRAGRYILVNNAEASSHGVKPREMIGKTDANLFSPEIVEQIRLRDLAILADGCHQIYEQSFTGKDGSTHVFLIAKYPRRAAGGEVAGVIGIARDITDRKRAEEALRLAHDELEQRVAQRTAQLAEAVERLQREIGERRRTARQLARRSRQLQSLADHSPDLILRIDRDGKYVFVNRRLSEFFGVPREELLGRSHRELELPVSIRGYWESLCRAIFQHAVPSESEFMHETSSGLRYFQISAVPETDAHGRVETVLATVRDITEFKQAQEQLRHSERLASIGTLAAGIAHEINNPTGGILMASQAALDDFDDRSFVRKCLNEIIDDAKRCSRIVKSVLRFSRQQPSELAPHDLNALVRRAAGMAQELLGSQSGRLELDLDESIQEAINVNSTEMEQVLINLIRNAFEAGGPDVCVKLHTSKVDNMLRLVVSDNGPGMTSEQAGRIFDPFYTTRANQGGTGLGLSIVHGIVRAHGGTIKVESAPRAGCTFVIELPVYIRTLASP